MGQCHRGFRGGGGCVHNPIAVPNARLAPIQSCHQRHPFFDQASFVSDILGQKTFLLQSFAGLFQCSTNLGEFGVIIQRR